MRPRPLSALALALGLGGCSATGVLAGLTPGPHARGAAAYAEGPRHGLDVYQPTKSGGLRPVVVFFYGGGWDQGDRRQYRFVGKALAAKGYVVVIPDYRIYPEALYPAFLQDSALAVRWARDHARDYGGDSARLFLMGHSAGAYNAAMLTYDSRWLAEVGLDPRRDVRGFVGLAGPYDFLPLQSARLKTIFGPEDRRPATQPINHVDGDEPPALLMHGLDDKVVEPGNAQRLAARVGAKGGRAEVVTFNHLSHALIVGALSAPLRLLAPVMGRTTSFIDGEAAR